MSDRYFEVTDKESDHAFYLQVGQNDTLTKAVALSLGVIGNGVEAAALAKAFEERNTKRYVFRKMGFEEFKQTIEQKKMMYASTTKPKNELTSEKWLSESLEHTREFTNKGNTGPEKVVEFAVDKKGYEKLSDAAIPQTGSSKLQPQQGTRHNVYNKELIEHIPKKKNIGLKGRPNVDTFNETVISVTEINPKSLTNKSNILKWIRRNKLSAAGIAIGIIIDGAAITITAIEEGGFGTSTKVAFGKTIAGMVGSAAAVAIGAQIGSVLGTVVPGIGNVVLGFIGGFIGALIGGSITSLICRVDPVAPGLETPVLDTDPMDSGDDVSTGAMAAPSLESLTDDYGPPDLEMNTVSVGTQETN